MAVGLTASAEAPSGHRNPASARSSTVKRMILWLNGTFGVGKTTTARLLADGLDNTRTFDPEHAGYMLSANFTDFAFDDFQELAVWRELVPLILDRVQHHTASRIVAPQTVLVEQYWTELHLGALDLGLDLIHVVLDCSEAEQFSRIDRDETESRASPWRQRHVPEFLAARSWMLAAADLVVDTTELRPEEVATAIGAMVDAP